MNKLQVKWNKMSHVFVLIHEEGQYSDYVSEVIGVYSSLEKAKDELQKKVKDYPDMYHSSDTSGTQTCQTMYITETELDRSLDHKCTPIWMLLEGEFICYKSGYPYYNNYFTGTLAMFKASDKTYHNGEVMFVHLR